MSRHRGTPDRIRTERQLRAMKPGQAEARIRSAEAIKEMRKGASLRAAADLEHTTPETVRAYFGHLLSRPTRGGRYRVAQSDREPFLLDVVGEQGIVERVVRGSAARDLNQRHHRAIAVYGSVGGGDESVFDPFRGKRVGGIPLLVDADEIDHRLDAGEFDWLDYSSF